VVRVTALAAAITLVLGGDAVHYFPRLLGWPQSLGCVELPRAAPQRA
jgi:hypothetical protein